MTGKRIRIFELNNVVIGMAVSRLFRCRICGKRHKKGDTLVSKVQARHRSPYFCLRCAEKSGFLDK